MESLENVTLSIIKEGLSAENYLVAHGYVGATNMSGNQKDVGARIGFKVSRAMN